MYRRFVTGSLVLLMLSFAAGKPAFAVASNDKKLSKAEAKIAKRSAKIKKAVIKLGPGKDSVVKVKLRDKTKIRGYIGQIGETDFTIIDKAGNSHVVEYTKAKQIKGNNLHAGIWVAIGVGLAVAVILIILNKTLD